MAVSSWHDRSQPQVYHFSESQFLHLLGRRNNSCLIWCFEKDFNAVALWKVSTQAGDMLSAPHTSEQGLRGMAQLGSKPSQPTNSVFLGKLPSGFPGGAVAKTPELPMLGVTVQPQVSEIDPTYHN